MKIELPSTIDCPHCHAEIELRATHDARSDVITISIFEPEKSWGVPKGEWPFNVPQWPELPSGLQLVAWDNARRYPPGSLIVECEFGDAEGNVYDAVYFYAERRWAIRGARAPR
jgi:hypothetical protein